MSGQKINDHHQWMGGKSKESVMPIGVKSKSEAGPEGAGMLNKYEDTAEAIKAAQSKGISKIKARPMKQPDRN